MDASERERTAERAAMLPCDPEPGEIVFASDRGGVAISDMTMLKAHKLVAPGSVPHGWRSTFRDWAAETTDHPSDVCEAAPAHLVEDKVQRSYLRGPLLEKRRRLMEDWAAYLLPSAEADLSGAVKLLAARLRSAA